MGIIDAPGISVKGDAARSADRGLLDTAAPLADARAATGEGKGSETYGTWARILLLLTPGAPPRGWTLRAAVIMTGTLGCIALFAAVGIALRDNAGAAFQEEQPGTWASAGLMLWAGALAAWVWVTAGPGARRSFWAIAAVGMAFLAIDDLFWIHERLDEAVHRMLGWNVRDPVTDHLDDVIVLGYGLIAAAVLWRFRRELLDLPWFALSLAAAACFFAAMVVMDITYWGGLLFEEGAKLLGAACIVCAMYAAVLDLGGLRRPGRGEAPAT